LQKIKILINYNSLFFTPRSAIDTKFKWGRIK